MGKDQVSLAGPIQTEIWEDAIHNAEPAEKKGSVFSDYVQKAHRLSEKETSKPGWFWEPSIIGERVWKVSLPHRLQSTDTDRCGTMIRMVHLLSEYEKQEPCEAIVSSVMAVITFSMTGHEHIAQQRDLLKSSMLQARCVG